MSASYTRNGDLCWTTEGKVKSIYQCIIYIYVCISTWLNSLISFIIIIIVAHGIILFHMTKHYAGMFYVIAAKSSRTIGHHVSGRIRIASIVQWMPTSCIVTDTT